MKKTVLITGSCSGLGFELAKQCGKKGFNVIISGRNEITLRAALKALKKEIPSVYSLIIDVSKQDSIENATYKLSEENIELDVLVNNAAVISKNDINLTEIGSNVFIETITTNAFAALWVTQAMLPFLKSPGKIVMMSSVAGIMTDKGTEWAPAYCISKSILNTITKQLAFELKNKNIAVNAVCPGWVKTNMGGLDATRSLDKGVETPLWIINDLPTDFTGNFYFDKNIIQW